MSRGLWVLIALSGVPRLWAEEPVDERVTSSQYELTGECEPNTTPVLLVNGVQHAKLDQDRSGAFRFYDIQLREGLNVLTVTVADVAGNVSTATKRVFLDSTAPPWQFVWPPNEYRTKERQLTITGQSEAGALAVLSHNGRKHAEAVLPRNGRVYLHVSNLSPGRHRFDVAASDALGNTTTDTLYLIVQAPPSLELYPSWSGSRTRQRNLGLEGRTEPGAVVTLYDGEVQLGEVALQRSGRFRFRLRNLGYGLHEFGVVATDDLGSETRKEVAVQVKAPPLLQLDRELDGTTIGSRSVTVKGQSERGVTLMLRDNDTPKEPLELLDSTAFTFSLDDLDIGPHTFRVVATDDVGNIVQDQIEVTIKAPPPLRLSGQWDPCVALAQEIVLSGQTEAGATVGLRMDGDAHSSVVADQSGGFSFHLTQLAHGEHALEVTATDRVGLSTQVPASLRVAFPLKIDTPKAASLLNHRKVEVAGTAHPEIPVSLSVNGARPVPGETDVEGNYVFHDVALAEGRNTVTVNALPGRETLQEQSVSLTTDTTAPTLQVLLPKPGTHLSRRATSDVIVSTEPGAWVTISLWRDKLASLVAPANGYVTLRDVSFPTNTNLLSVVARDTAGNATKVDRWVWRGPN